ncbi:hypothetical protein BKA65DRAFT_126014 [Rhexocercosporidium sp. MPI-PUGE-AT-0058]|nr:hypothetical protein BKA65DRAFT_126014 [Rhexocercosporidium sp. MPI-PUGE-AT-0058]
MSTANAGTTGHLANNEAVLAPQEGILSVTNSHLSVNDLQALLQTAILQRDEARIHAEHTQIWGYGEAERSRTLANGLERMKKEFSNTKNTYAKAWAEQNEMQTALRGKLHERDAYINILHERLRLYEQTGLQPVSGVSDQSSALVANPFSRSSFAHNPNEFPRVVPGHDVAHFCGAEHDEASTSTQKNGGTEAQGGKGVGGRDLPK